MGYSRKPRKSGGWRDVLAGKPGYVYILENPGLRAGLLKIGGTQRSGAIRARELNEDAGTGTPGAYTCVFQFSCLDCGAAEKRVHKEFAKQRTFAKRGQEFFDVDRERAIAAILRACAAVDAELAPPPTAPPLQAEPPRRDEQDPVSPQARVQAGQVARGDAREASRLASSAVSQPTTPRTDSESEELGPTYRVLLLIVVALFAWMVTCLPSGRPIGAQLLSLVAERPALWVAVVAVVVVLVWAVRFLLAGLDQKPVDRRIFLGTDPMVRYWARPAKSDLARSLRDDSVPPVRRTHRHRSVSDRPTSRPSASPTTAQASAPSTDRSAYWRQLGGRMTGRRDVCRRCDSETAVVTVGSTALCSVCGAPSVR